MTLPPALPGERFAFDGLSCYTAGSGPPLLLVHSVNATASAAEVRPVYERMQASHTVFAIDLPGYGFSDRSDRNYTPRVMTDALHAAARQIHLRCGVQPVPALAVSLSCEFMARAAVERPSNWGPLALVSPTGFKGTKAWRKPAGSTREVPGLHAVLSAPLWAEALFRRLTRPGVVRYFLEKTWGDKRIDEPMCAYAVLSAQAPGGRFAPLHFLSGGLFSADIHPVYEAVRQPVWMSHGVRGDFTDYRGKTLVEGRPNWRISVLQTGALPYFEQPVAFCRQLAQFVDAG